MPPPAPIKPHIKPISTPHTSDCTARFLAETASDVVEVRRLKANLVSINVERLVQEGYLVRCPVQGDRRKTQLFCTEKAQPVIRQGRKMQKDFFEKLFAGVDEPTRQAVFSAMQSIEKNLEEI